MKRDELLEALNERVPFRIARRLLVASDFPTGHGWDSVSEKLTKADVAAKADDNKLLKLYTGALAVSEKRLSIYDLGNGKALPLRAALNKQIAIDSGSPLSAAYPIPLSKPNLDSLTSTDPVVVGKVGYGNGEIFIISYVKETRHRVALSPSQIKSGGGVKFTEVYGIRIERSQSFDALLFQHSGDRLFLLTDVLENKSQEATRDSVSRIATLLKNNFATDLKGKRVNLFPAIAKFYTDPDADIIRLDHTTTDGQAISEITKGNQQCVRAGEFHKGGMSAVNGGTDAFGVEVAWDVNNTGNLNNRAELSLIGNGSIALGLNPAIEFGLIGKAGTLEELTAIIRSLDAKV